MTVNHDSEITINSSLLGVFAAQVSQDMWAVEATRNAIQYGGSICVFGIVWDAVRKHGNYPIGIWSDTVFEPSKMVEYMPHLGVGEIAAGRNANFHAGTRLSILGWSNFAVVSMPDPSKPDDIYVIYLYKDDADGSFRVRSWTNGVASILNMSKVIHAADLTPEEVEMLGFDPLEIPMDEGWINRLEDAKLVPSQRPMTCFVLTGRGKLKDTWQGETGKGRPVTRSIINDRFWKPPIPVWGWEFTKPDQRDQWLTEPPDGQPGGTPWKDDDTHQWRRQHGLSQVTSGTRRDAAEFNQEILLGDGTFVETWVFPQTKAGKSPLDNAAYDVVRNGGFVLDHDGEHYLSGRGRAALNPWGIFNVKVAERTLIKVSPPKWDEGDPEIGGLATADIGRSNLLWQEGLTKIKLPDKIQAWQHEYRQRLNDELSGLLDILHGTAISVVDPADLTKDLKELATELGTLYTKKVVRQREVPDPDATKTVTRMGKPRRKRESKICPECFHKLPFPGHDDACSLKPVPRPPKPVDKGRLDWDGDPDEDAIVSGTGKNVVEGDKHEVPDPDATKKEDYIVDEPDVSFPYIRAVDRSVIGDGFIGVSWHPLEIGPGGEHGVLDVAWGSGPNPDRYPTLIQAHEKLAERYHLDPLDLAGHAEVERALWEAIVRIASGKFGHVLGQVDAGTFGRDDEAINKIREDENHDAVLYGMTWALFGIQDLMRFATPILAHTLGKALARP